MAPQLIEQGAAMAMRAYRELTGDETAVWDRFDAVFDFRASMHRFPAITEPTPSVTWSLSSFEDDPGYGRLDRLVEVVHAGFTTLAGMGSILCLDWQHPSYRVWPSLIGSENIDPPGQPGWPLSPHPDGDYYIYLAEDFRFGTFAHPWEPSLCVFGGDLLGLVEANPFGHTQPAWIAVILGGPALFLAGRAGFEYAVFARVSRDRPIGLVVLAALTPAMLLLPPLLVAFAATAVLAGVAISDATRARAHPAEPPSPPGAPS